MTKGCASKALTRQSTARQATASSATSCHSPRPRHQVRTTERDRSARPRGTDERSRSARFSASVSIGRRAYPARVCALAPPDASCRNEPRNRGAISALALLLDLGGLAAQLAQVVELGATDVTAGHDLDLLHDRGVHRERALHADAEADLAGRE